MELDGGLEAWIQEWNSIFIDLDILMLYDLSAWSRTSPLKPIGRYDGLDVCNLARFHPIQELFEWGRKDI